MITKKDIEFAVTFIAIVIGLVYFWDRFTDGWKFIITISCTAVTSIIVALVFFWVGNFLNYKSMGSIARKAKKEGVDLGSSEPEELRKIVLILDDFASSEKLINRVTDAIGYLLMLLSWLMLLGCVVGYGYFIFTSVSNSAYGNWILLWIPIVYSSMFNIFNLFIAVICKVLFNRYPFEARRIRKHIDTKLDHILHYK